MWPLFLSIKSATTCAIIDKTPIYKPTLRATRMVRAMFSSAENILLRRLNISNLKKLLLTLTVLLFLTAAANAQKLSAKADFECQGPMCANNQKRQIFLMELTKYLAILSCERKPS